MDQYEEHLAHSAPCSSQWDGFDRGDTCYEDGTPYGAAIQASGPCADLEDDWADIPF